MAITVDAVAAKDLTKKYGKLTALSSVDLTVPQGSVFACVGAKDSGKTTFLRLLCGLCTPSAGSCSVMGMTPSNNPPELHRLLGAVLNSSRAYRNLTIYENILFFAKINGVESNDAIDRASFLLHRLGIWQDRDSLPMELPSGVTYRGSVARALVHSPHLLLLDEPRGGINTETCGAIKSLVEELSQTENLTTVFCTEDFDCAEYMCGAFGIFDRGRLLASGTAQRLVKICKVKSHAVLKLVGEDNTPEGFERYGEAWRREIDSEEDMPQIISSLNESGAKLLEARVERPGLKDVSNLLLKTHLEKSDEDDGEKGGAEKTASPQGDEGAGASDGPGATEEAGGGNDSGGEDEVPDNRQDEQAEGESEDKGKAGEQDEEEIQL